MTTNGPTFLVAGNHYYGTGPDLTTAKANFRKYGGTLSDGYTIVEFDSETEFVGMDDLGRYHYKRRDGRDARPNTPKETLVNPRVRGRR